jgi:hypothetical protein
MKRILIAISLVAFMLGASSASANLEGQCNANLGRSIGDANQWAHDDVCTDVIEDGNEFFDMGCFPLLFDGELFFANLGDNATELLGNKLCTASCTCFFPVAIGSPLDLACGCGVP